MVPLISLLFIVFLFNLIQSAFTRNSGSDNAVHLFLINQIRKNKNKLFTRIPRLLNKSSIGALPLYLHWCVSWFDTKKIASIQLLLNPCVSLLHSVVIYFISLHLYCNWLYSFQITLLFSLTPQFFHAYSAKNFGISSRGIGFLLFTVFFFCIYCARVESSFFLAGAIFSGFLIWGFNTFALQALFIFAMVFLVLWKNPMPLAGLVLGFSIFYLIDPKYAKAYVDATGKYINCYRNEIAKKYVLKHRKSIWLDLIIDIWIQIKYNLPNGLKYAYGNTVLIIIFLNPILIISLFLYIFNNTNTVQDQFLYQTVVAGIIATILTSFRGTRFLGEPERYAELVTPWSVMLFVSLGIKKFGSLGLILFASYYVLMVLVQIYLSKLIRARHGQLENDLKKIVSILSKTKTIIKICSNNEQITKKLMENNWKFACCISAGEKYGGMNFSDVFLSYPFLQKDSLIKIINKYKINTVLFDKQLKEKIDLRCFKNKVKINKKIKLKTLNLLKLKWLKVSESKI